MYNSKLITGKLLRWQNYLNKHSLPNWDELPSIGLYMDQVITLISQYLSFLPANTDDQVITASAINNYVRMKIMPAPEKKKYNRIHLAYLIMICSLKQSLSISDIQRIIPAVLNESEVKDAYNDFVSKYTSSMNLFVDLVEEQTKSIFDESGDIDQNVNSFILLTAVVANFSKILTTKLLDLQDKPFSEDAIAEKE
ncbi:MAG: DUF1836 domain-containing protein [Clostridia bacterium]|nr:DUF1836 domain-containing protein [Clostridia bacterium]MBR2878206.1 DUF1836 domain-containing protein [Clostridia bacterium]